MAYNSERRKERYEKNKDKEKRQAKMWREQNRTQAKEQEYRHRYKYGVEPQDYEFIFTRQEGKCAICRNGETRLYIDHSHETGVVRGLLCHQCNIGLGNFKDDEKRLAQAINYLNGGYFGL